MVTARATMPLLGESVSEGTIVRWLKVPGDYVPAGEPLFEVSTDKVDTEVPARFGGRLISILVAEGEVALVGQDLAVFETDGSIPDTADGGVPSPAAVQQPDVELHPAPGRTARVVPLPPRRTAVSSISAVSPVGPSVAPGRLAADRPSAPPVPAPAGATVVPHSPLRRAIASRMTDSLHTAAHTLVVMEADYEAVHAAREVAKRRFGSAASPLTYLPFVCRAIVEASRAYPHVNAHVREGELHVFSDVHLGIAVDLETEGLVVPVIDCANDLRLGALAAKIVDVADRARRRALGPTEASGGTITVTNSGGRGSLLGRPVINLPQAVIVETDLVENRVIGDRDAAGSPVFRLRRRGYLSMSYDHRAFDGAYACGFLAAVCEDISTRDWTAEL